MTLIDYSFGFAVTAFVVCIVALIRRDNGRRQRQEDRALHDLDDALLSVRWKCSLRREAESRLREAIR